jgi:hypothetical protein
MLGVKSLFKNGYILNASLQIFLVVSVRLCLKHLLRVHHTLSRQPCKEVLCVQWSLQYIARRDHNLKVAQFNTNLHRIINIFKFVSNVDTDDDPPSETFQSEFCMRLNLLFKTQNEWFINSYTSCTLLMHQLYRDSAVFNVPYSVLINGQWFIRGNVDNSLIYFHVTYYNICVRVVRKIYQDKRPDQVSNYISSRCTMALGSTQPLTEMSTRSLPGGKGQPAHKAENLTVICEPIV